MTDRDLLNHYIQTRSNDAFNHLVHRHVDLVYSAAKRQLRDEHLAQDATQAVFLLLSQKAHSLHHEVVLGGWLLNTTRFVCQNAIRLAARRTIHEHKAAAMKTQETHNAVHDDWFEMSGLLDEAMISLANKDRDALVLRYFQDKSFVEVAQATGTTEEAARKRVARAVGRLGEFFQSHGIILPAAGLETILLVEAVQPAPPAVVAAASSPSPAAHLLAQGTAMTATKAITAIAAAALC